MGKKTAEDLARELRDDINSGRLPEGQKLPSINELAETHKVGRGAVQQALATLRAAGLIESRHGAGSYVKRRLGRITRTSPHRLAAERWGGGHAIQDADTGPRPRPVNVEVDEVPAPEFVAEAFGMEPGAPVVRRSRVYQVEQRPVMWAVSYLPVELAQGTAIVYTDTGPGGVYARLAEQGWGPTRFVRRLIGRPPLPEEVERLGMRRAKAMVLQVTRFAWSGDRCVEVNRMVLDAEVYELVDEFPA